VFSHLGNGPLPEVLLHELRARLAARREVAQFVEDDYRGKRLTQISEYVVPKHTKRAEVEAAARQVVQSFTEQRSLHYLQSYIANYLASGEADSLLTETYSRSGVLGGSKALQSFATAERIERISSNIQIKIGFQRV